MVKTREDSRIVIWNSGYINNIDARNANDRDIDIIQIQSCGNDSFMVEIAEKDSKINQLVEEMIRTIDEEIENSGSVCYTTKEGYKLSGADINDIYDWFEQYKEVLRERYPKEKNKQVSNKKIIIDIYMTSKTSAQFREYEKRLLEHGDCDYSVYDSTFNKHEYQFPKQNILVRILALPTVSWFDEDSNCPDYYYTNNSLAASVLDFILEGRQPIILESFDDVLKLIDSQKE